MIVVPYFSRYIPPISEPHKEPDSTIYYMVVRGLIAIEERDDRILVRNMSGGSVALTKFNRVIDVGGMVELQRDQVEADLAGNKISPPKPETKTTTLSLEV